jgi:cytochrome c-type biogenesis protein CcmH/NrfF
MHALVALLLLMQTELPAVEQTPTEAPAVMEEAGQEAVSAPAEEERVCRRRSRIGTRFGSEECRTRSEADSDQQLARETMRDIMENSGRNNTPSD